MSKTVVTRSLTSFFFFQGRNFVLRGWSYVKQVTLHVRHKYFVLYVPWRVYYLTTLGCRYRIALINTYGVSVEWHWQGKTKNLPHCQFSRYKSYMNWPSIEPGPPRLCPVRTESLNILELTFLTVRFAVSWRWRIVECGWYLPRTWYRVGRVDPVLPWIWRQVFSVKAPYFCQSI